MSYVRAHDLLGTRLLTDDAAAGYVILELLPRSRRCSSTTATTCTRRSVIYDYFTLTGGKPGWGEVLDRYDVEVDRVGQGQPLAALLDQSPEWERVHRDATDAVWVRSGTSLPEACDGDPRRPAASANDVYRGPPRPERRSRATSPRSGVR